MGHRRLAWCGEQPQQRFEGRRGLNGAGGGRLGGHRPGRGEDEDLPGGAEAAMWRDTELVNQHAGQRSQGKKRREVRRSGRAWVRRGPEGQAALKGWGPQNDSSVSGASGSQPGMSVSKNPVVGLRGFPCCIPRFRRSVAERAWVSEPEAWPQPRPHSLVGHVPGEVAYAHGVSVSCL